MLGALVLPLVAIQVAILNFLGIQAVEHSLLAREPAFLELRTGHSVATAQELLVFLQQFPPVSRVTYRTREQQFLGAQAMFPDARSPERSVALFHDALLVHVRTEQGYRSLLGALMAEPRWQGLIAPNALVRTGEQAQKMHFIATVFQALRLGVVSVIVALSCGMFLSLLRSARQALSIEEENGALQDSLGATPLSIAGPVACRLTTVVFSGVLLSLLMVPMAMQLQLLHRTWWPILLMEGAVAAFLSIGGVLFSRYAPCAPVRRAHSANDGRR